VRDEQSAVRVLARVQRLHRVSLFEVQVDVKPGVDAAAVSRRLDGLIAELIANGPTEDEVRRTVMRTLSTRIQGLERVGGFNSKSVALAEGMLYANNPDFNREELRKLAASTPCG
jgi:acetyl/propionyl-CoA carboxylase alpha subunit